MQQPLVITGVSVLRHYQWFQSLFFFSFWAVAVVCGWPSAVRVGTILYSFGVKDPVDCARSWFQSLTPPCSISASSVNMNPSDSYSTASFRPNPTQDNAEVTTESHHFTYWQLTTFASDPLYRLSLYTLKSIETAFHQYVCFNNGSRLC
jgi:hypothetical protein